MAGHHPLAELRAGIATDPARTERLAAAKRQIAEEQAAYDEAVAAVERVRASTHEQLALALALPVTDVARIERHAAQYLSMMQNCLQAMGGESELLLAFGAGPARLQLVDLFPPRTPADQFAATDGVLRHPRIGRGRVD